MHHRLAGVALAALSIAVWSSAYAQPQNPPERKPDAAEQKPNREPDNLPTPIKAFSDAAGQWYGWVDLTTRVAMFIGADGMVKFQGPRDVTQHATILHDRLYLQSRDTDLDCGLMNGFLTCNARFGTWYAALSLRKL